MKIQFSRQARQDLIEIGEYIAGDNPSAALRYVNLIEANCLSLGRMPHRFPIAWRLEVEVRQRVVGRHYIFYSVERDRIMIRRIMDSARDLSPDMIPR